MLSSRDMRRLKGVHPDLVKVVERAATLRLAGTGLFVIEGVRAEARQRELVAAGASKTMDSRHLTGHAVDLAVTVGGELTWSWHPYEALADDVKRAAQDLGVVIEWGGDWPKFKDGPHFQLPKTVVQ
jgi:peptidoglycan L-alanyl-D-glutamate endopeptidase CwlK